MVVLKRHEKWCIRALYLPLEDVKDNMLYEYRTVNCHNVRWFSFMG